MKPDRKTTRQILQHWRWWSRDLPPDSAEIHYYTVSPMFRDYAKPTPKSIKYDTKTAEMVEEVMKDLFDNLQKKSREWLILYWLYIPNNQDLADVLSNPKARKQLPLNYLRPHHGVGLSVAERTVRRKVAEAHDVFAKFWGLRFMGD